MTSDVVRRLVRGAAYGALCAVGVSLVALVVRERADTLVGFDEWAVRAGTDYARSHPTLLQGLIAWQWATQPKFVYLVLVPVTAWLGARARRSLAPRAAWAFMTMMLVWALAAVMKEIVHRARPVIDDPVSHAPGFSFPSGHSANAMGAAAVMVVLLWPLLSRGGRVAASAIAVVFVLVTGLDRVLLGVHYPTDVIGGFLLGAGMVAASYRGFTGGLAGRSDTSSDTRSDSSSDTSSEANSDTSSARGSARRRPIGGGEGSPSRPAERR